MDAGEITGAQRRILEVLRRNPGLLLREIHADLVALDESDFTYSPAFGEGWNDERRRVQKLKQELAARDLITNDYQKWYLTKTGRETLS